MKNLILFILTFSLSFALFAKRLAPANIEPIKTKRGTIHNSFERNALGFTVYVLMKDKAGDLKWKTKLFSRKYEKGLETDVQDIHLKKISLEEAKVIAVDEHGRSYELESSDGSLIKPTKPFNY